MPPGGKLQKNPKALGWFVGQVMKTTRGQANPQPVNEVLRRRLEE
jgi:aspartyl-tRNA(Asn)/glutamyl-tRNA(Gln) amidotransferase subunit B